MKSALFHTEAYVSVQARVRDLLNRSPDFLSSSTAQSPRAVGDAIEALVAGSFDKILGEYGGEYSTGFARRAIDANVRRYRTVVGR